MDFEQYRALDGMNWSTLKLLAASALHYMWALTHPSEDKPAYAEGRAIHCAVLEPDAFDEQYVVRPDGLDLRTKAGKEWKAEVGDREVISPAVLEVRDAVLAHAEARRIIEMTEHEYSVQAQINGIDAKGRFDCVHRACIADLKTTAMSLDRFPTEAARYLYHGQLAWYLDMAIAAGVCDDDARAWIIAVEKSPPYDVGCFLLSHQEIEAGRVLYRSLIDKLASCKLTGMWPGRCPGVTPLSLPDWADGMKGEGEFA